MTPLLLAERIAAFAESIVNTVRRTDYQHDERIDGAAGVYECDSSGFVGFVSRAVAREQHTAVPNEAGQRRPRACEYDEHFSTALPSLGGWRRVAVLLDLRRGDVVAWPSAEIEPRQDTGHVCVAAGAPVVVEFPRVLAVRVYDSTDTPHCDDSRAEGPERFRNGVGSGPIHFTADALGRPLAVRCAASEPFAARPIGVGRAMPARRGAGPRRGDVFGRAPAR